MNIPGWPVIKKFLGALTDLLLIGRKGGLYEVGQGPNLGTTPHFLVGNAAPAPFFGDAKDKIKDALVKAGLQNVQKRFDTPEEAKVIISGIHVPGVSADRAWIASLFTGLATMLLVAVGQSDAHLLLVNWREWLIAVINHVDWMAFSVGLGTTLKDKFFLWIKQDSHNATVVLKQDTVKNIAVIQASE